MSKQAGKGDKPRPTKKDQYDSNFDSIKWKTNKHKTDKSQKSSKYDPLKHLKWE